MRRQKRLLVLVALGIGCLGGWSLYRAIAYAVQFQHLTPAVLASSAKAGGPVAAAPAPESGRRPVYPYSVIPGGAYDRDGLSAALLNDPVAAAHYSVFDLENTAPVRLAQSRRAYVSFRKEGTIYWTRNPILLSEGETLLSDGTHQARARCGNRISFTPQTPVLPEDPPPVVWDQPIDGEDPDDLGDSPVESLNDLPQNSAPPFGLFLAPNLFAPPDLVSLAVSDPALSPMALLPAGLTSGGIIPPGLELGRSLQPNLPPSSPAEPTEQPIHDFSVAPTLPTVGGVVPVSLGELQPPSPPVPGDPLPLPPVISTHLPYSFPDPWPQPILWSISVTGRTWPGDPGDPGDPGGPGSPPTRPTLEKLVSPPNGQASPVPEPASFLLIGAGLLALKLMRR